MKVGDEIEIVGEGDAKTVVTGVEMFLKLLDAGRGGRQHRALLLRGVGRGTSSRGQVWQAGVDHAAPKFEAEAYILTKEEGRPHTPFFTNYRPQFYFRTTDVTGRGDAAGRTEMVMPGDNAQMVVELISRSPMDEGCASPSARAAAPSAPASSPNRLDG